MRLKIKYIIFSLAISTLFLSVFFVVPDTNFLFKNALGDCSGRTQFMYNALYKQKREADVVLFGSSRIMNGVIDTLQGKNKLLNLGYCRFGRNLDEFFIEEYLKTHQPKKLILEIREEEGDNSHPLTPFLLPVSKIAEGFLTLDADVFSNLYNKGLCNLKFIRNKLFSKTGFSAFESSANYGFWENLSTPDFKQLNNKRAEDSIEFRQADIPKNINHNSDFYFKKVKALCEQKNIKLYFLYFPSYGNVYRRPSLETEFLKYGQCIVPPDSLFSNAVYFSDYNHLNRNGARRFSVWFNNYLEHN